MTQPSYIAKAEYTWTGTSQAFTIPTVQDGDLAILVVHGGSTAVGTLTFPAESDLFYDWEGARDVGLQTLRWRAWSLLATDSGTTVTVTTENAGHCGVLLVYRGVTGLAAAALWNGTALGTSHVGPTVACGDEDIAVHVAACYRASAAAVLETTTGTERADLTNGLYELEAHDEAGPVSSDVTWTATRSISSGLVMLGIKLSGTAAAAHIYKGRATQADDTTGAA